MRPKPLSKEDILRAQRHTKSNRAAARYLGCSYQHYKPYAKLFVDEETGLTLFELHKNQSGKGIPKRLGAKNKHSLEAIFNGDIDTSHFEPEKIKSRLIHESYLAEECSKCGFNERRVLDYKIPLLLNFKDKNKKNYKLENLELLCYNCFFLYIGDVFSKQQENEIQDVPRDTFIEKPTWDLDNDTLENMKALGIL